MGALQIDFIGRTMSKMVFIVPEEGGVVIKTVLQIDLRGLTTGTDCLLCQRKPFGQNVLFGCDLHMPCKQMVKMTFSDEQSVADFFNAG